MTDKSKMDFDPYDCINPVLFKKWHRDLTAYLNGISDASGSTCADTLEDSDMGGAGPGATPFPAAGTLDGTAMRRLRVARQKKVFSAVYDSITNENVKTVIHRFYRIDGRQAFLYIQNRCDHPITLLELQTMNTKWDTMSIVRDIGIKEESVLEFELLIERENQERPVASRYSETDKAEKMLISIARASRHFQESALVEFNRPVGTRLFEHPPPVAGAVFAGAAIPPGLMVAPVGVQHRNMRTLTDHYAGLWRQAVKDGLIAKTPAASGGPTIRHQVERGNAAGESNQTSSSGAHWNRYATPGNGPAQTLPALFEAGFTAERGITTTTDWSQVDADSLAEAVAYADASEDGFSIEICCDATDTESVEMICHNCRGLGHAQKDCPSVRKPRTLDFAIELLNRSKQRAASRGNPTPSRPARRGQTFPKRKWNPTPPKANLAEEAPQQEEVPTQQQGERLELVHEQPQQQQQQQCYISTTARDALATRLAAAAPVQPLANGPSSSRGSLLREGDYFDMLSPPPKETLKIAVESRAVSEPPMRPISCFSFLRRRARPVPK